MNKSQIQSQARKELCQRHPQRLRELYLEEKGSGTGSRHNAIANAHARTRLVGEFREEYRRIYAEIRSRPDAGKPRDAPPPKGTSCTVKGCTKPRKPTYQMCSMHRYRKKIHGTTDPGLKCHAPIAERWSRFVVRSTECWEWTGTKNNHGYGRLGQIYAHRISYERMFGPIPQGMHVLHRCDNPPCTNPSHLMLGTHQDNMADMKHKGRAHGWPDSLKRRVGGRITAAHVAEMRSMKAAGATSREIAAHFEISANYVTQLISGRMVVSA